jgi:hypothetical protein
MGAGWKLLLLQEIRESLRREGLTKKAWVANPGLNQPNYEDLSIQMRTPRLAARGLGRRQRIVNMPIGVKFDMLQPAMWLGEKNKDKSKNRAGFCGFPSWWLG